MAFIFKNCEGLYFESSFWLSRVTYWCWSGRAYCRQLRTWHVSNCHRPGHYTTQLYICIYIYICIKRSLYKFIRNPGPSTRMTHGFHVSPEGSTSTLRLLMLFFLVMCRVVGSPNLQVLWCALSISPPRRHGVEGVWGKRVHQKRWELVVGFKYFLFSPRKLWKIPILPNIFQMGWFNHQLVLLYVAFEDLIGRCVATPNVSPKIRWMMRIAGIVGSFGL